jgi:hypothetical protein
MPFAEVRMKCLLPSKPENVFESRTERADAIAGAKENNATAKNARPGRTACAYLLIDCSSFSRFLRHKTNLAANGKNRSDLESQGEATKGACRRLVCVCTEKNMFCCFSQLEAVLDSSSLVSSELCI